LIPGALYSAVQELLSSTVLCDVVVQAPKVLADGALADSLSDRDLVAQLLRFLGQLEALFVHHNRSCPLGARHQLLRTCCPSLLGALKSPLLAVVLVV
jgi:hypothetical protein